LRNARQQLTTARLLQFRSADRLSESEDVMNKVIFVGFDAEQKAYEGDRALHDLHRDGTLTLYNDAVVVKEPGGTVVVRRAPEAEPVGTFGGMITGGLIGLLGGPVGAAVGLGAGTLIGAAFDLTEEGIDRDFVEDAGTRLEPGTAALIAEIDEQWQVPLDTRMEALGGKVLRQTRSQVEDAYADRGLEAAAREVTALEAEKVAQVQAGQTEKARKQAEKLQAKIDAAQRKLQAKHSELAAKMQAVKEEGNRKIAVLEAQKATAAAESTALLDERLSQVRSEYGRRSKRLQEALEVRKAAHAEVRA
jgi:uncharacterized membrane protein